VDEFRSVEGAKRRTWLAVVDAACCLLRQSSTTWTPDLVGPAPFLKLQYKWTNQDYALIVIDFVWPIPWADYQRSPIDRQTGTALRFPSPSLNRCHVHFLRFRTQKLHLFRFLLDC
jgi:hypothetical protein